MIHVVMRPCSVAVLFVLGVGSGAILAVDANLPLHIQIDSLVEAQAGGQFAAQSADAEFLRRIYLDLAGRIPALEETRAFLADSSTEKPARCSQKKLTNPHSLLWHPGGQRLAVVTTSAGSNGNGRPLDKDGNYKTNQSPIQVFCLPGEAAAG